MPATARIEARRDTTLVASGWTLLSFRFLKLLRQSRMQDRVHPQLAGVACGIGDLTLWTAALALDIHSDLMLRTATQFGLLTFVVTVFAVVSHRKIPFFSASAVPMLNAWRPITLGAIAAWMVEQVKPMRRTVLRFMTLLIMLSSGWVLAVAAEGIQFAAFMVAPNVAPVAPTTRTAPLVEEVHPARRALELNPIYDLSNADYFRLQRIDEATWQLKRDALGFPDWMSAIRSGAIAPRANLSGTGKMEILEQDVVMKNTKEMPFVRFPHGSHTLWLDCSNCHPTPFLPKAGANPVSMSEIFRGQYCGMCHDRVAFITFFSCARCHSVAQKTTVPKP